MPSSKTVFLSGATGHLGSELCRQLAEDGHEVRVMSRPGSDLSSLQGIDVKPVASHLDDQPGLEKAMKGCDWVFHVAANVSFWNARWTESYRTNVLGTRHMARAALKAGVGRFVYTSTVAALGKEDGVDTQVLDEHSRYNLEDKNMVYPHTKYLGDLEVEAAMADGLDGVITRPSVIVGPGDHKHHFLPVYQQAKQGLFLFFPDGTRNAVDVRDEARGHILVAEKGKKGESYVLGGENLTNRQLIGAFCKEMDGPQPLVSMPKEVFRAIGKLNDAVAALTGKEPFITTELAYQSTLFYDLRSDKAIRELGYSFRPFEEAFADMTAWYREQGLLG